MFAGFEGSPQYLFNGHNNSIINESCDVSTVIGVQSDLFSQTGPPVAIRRIAGLRQFCISFSNLEDYIQFFNGAQTKSINQSINKLINKYISQYVWSAMHIKLHKLN